MIVTRGLAIVLLLLPSGSLARAQSQPSSGAPPKLLLLVHQSFQPGKVSARRKLDVAMSRACNRVAVPNSWIDLEPITGDGQSRASFDPFDSFEELDKAGAGWAKIFSQPSEIAKIQEDIQALVASEQTVIAVRRDDVGYRVNTIDLSKARILRMLEVQLHPGRENDFIEAFKTLGGAYETINSDTPWVVYQVNAGMPTPSFLVFVPMKALRQNDDLLARQKSLRKPKAKRVLRVCSKSLATHTPRPKAMCTPLARKCRTSPRNSRRVIRTFGLRKQHQCIHSRREPPSRPHRPRKTDCVSGSLRYSVRVGKMVRVSIWPQS